MRELLEGPFGPHKGIHLITKISDWLVIKALILVKMIHLLTSGILIVDLKTVNSSLALTRYQDTAKK